MLTIAVFTYADRPLDSVQCEMSDSWRTSTEIRYVKTLTSVLSRLFFSSNEDEMRLRTRREPLRESSCLYIRVGKSGDRLERQGTLLEHDHHLRFDSDGRKDCPTRSDKVKTHPPEACVTVLIVIA